MRPCCGMEKAGFPPVVGCGDARAGPFSFAPGAAVLFNVGCSGTIVKGESGLIQYGDIDRFEPDGLKMKTGASCRRSSSSWPRLRGTNTR